MSSPGKIYEYGHGDVTTAKLYNFEIEKYDLKTEHVNWLAAAVAPKLRNGGSIAIVGLASRTGSDALNMKLSENRLQAVIDLLRRQAGNNFQVAIELPLGERAARLAGVADNVEHEGWRAVILSVWDKPTPPPPPPAPPPPPPSDVDYKWSKRWLGIGLKAGGQLGIGGYESVTAFMLCLGDLETFDLTISSARWGIGLGGSGAIVAVIGFGFSIPYELHGKSLDDWGVNAAFTEKLIPTSVKNSLQASKYLIDGFKNGLYVAPKMGKAFKYAGQLEQVRNLLHTLYAGFETIKGSGIVVVELPFLGAGLEGSAFVTRGTMYVANPSHWLGSD